MYDVIVIGGGAIGSSIARRLTRYNIDIALLEKNIEVCQETTKANSAIIHGGYDNKPGTLKAKLNVRGNELYPELANELDFEYKQIGSMVIAFSDKDMEKLEELYDRGIKNGVKGLKIINAKEAIELEPFVSEDIKAALYCSTAGIIDPFNYTYAMIENAIENGLDLFTEQEVIALENKDDYIRIITKDSSYKAKYVINAAGLNSDKVANMAGDKDFIIQPTKGVYRLLAKNPYQELTKVLFQTPSELGKGVLVTPTYDGNTMIGPTSERIDVKDYVDDEEYSLEILDELGKKSVPTIDFKRSIRVFTGIRAKPNTGDFMIYKSNYMQRVIHVGGIESPGLSSAPAIAEYVDKLLVDNGFDKRLDENYQPYRKRIIRTSKLSKKEKEELEKENPEYGEKICRCENVSKGEILEAIHRPGGARTRDGVKRRVRAGMGFCQGNYCAPRVNKILLEELNMDEKELKVEKSGSEMVKDYLNK